MTVVDQIMIQLSMSMSKSQDSIYVDPLDMAEQQQNADKEYQQKAAELHDDLMRRTGGQAVEEDLGGWLLAIYITLILLVIFLAFDTIQTCIAKVITGDYLISLQVIPLNFILAYPAIKTIYNIRKRRNPLRSMAFYAVVSIIIAILIALSSFQDYTAIGFERAAFGHGLDPLALVTAISAAIKIVLSLAVGVGGYIYFATSKRVRRTLVNKEI